MRQHVAVLDACKPVDGRPVESDALFERRVYIRWGNGYILEISQNVDEPKTEKADIALLDLLDDILLGIDHRKHPSHCGRA